jgi:O-antigen ligase
MFACSAGLVILLMVPDLVEGSLGLIGKDLTFSDRVSLWDYLLNGLPDHLMQGAGYQGFWITSSLKMSALFAQFPWMPNQAHNGYLDIVIETGLVGFSLFALALAAYARRAWADGSQGNLFQLILAGVLIMNLTETTLLIRGQVSFTIFFILYLWQYKPGQGDRAPAVRRGFGRTRR